MHSIRQEILGIFLMKAKKGPASCVFLGRTKADDAAPILKDTKGKPRIRIAVDNATVPSLQFLDENGKVTAELPQAK